MLLIKKGQTNNISVSVSLNATFSSPTYLFKFVNILSKDTRIFYPKVILMNERYDEFQFVEGSPTDLSQDPPVVSFKYEGQYWVYIYQMPCGSTSLDPLDGELLWDGRAQVNDDCPDPQYWQYESDNEDNRNFIFIQEDEKCPPTPSITATSTATPTPTPSITPTQTQTPSQTATQTPTQTATQTPTQTASQTPTQTPTQTQTGTPTQTPTQTQTGTPTNTPTQTQTGTPTNTPTQTQTQTPTQTPTNTATPTHTPTMTPTPTNLSGTTEANAYLEEILQAGATGITANISGATRTFFQQIMSNNLWDKIYAMYPYVGGVAAAHAVDARNNYNLVFSGGFTHNALGAKGNGTNGYANGGLTGSVFGSNPASLGVYVSLQGSGQRIYDMGVEAAGAPELRDMLTLAAKRRNDVGNNTLFDHGDFPNGRASTTGVTSASGMTIGSSTGTTSRNVYKNGTSVASQTASQALEVANRNIFIFAFNSYTGVNLYNDNTQAFAFMGSGMTASEVSTFSTIINNYQTALGRNVY